MIVNTSYHHLFADAPRGTADLHVAISEIDLEAGDFNSAKMHLEHAAAADDHSPMGDNLFRLFVVMAKIAATEGDALLAEVHLDRAARCAGSNDPFPVRRRCSILELLVFRRTLRVHRSRNRPMGVSPWRQSMCSCKAMTMCAMLRPRC